MVSTASGTGLKSFSLHRSRSDQAVTVASLQQESAIKGFGVDIGAPAEVDPETAARQHLATAFASAAAPDVSAPEPDGLTLEFKSLGTEILPLTGTKSVKFRQTYNKIPVYGSLVTVELDESNELIGINSALGAPEGVDLVASVAPAEALASIAKAGAAAPRNATGRPILYFDRHGEQPSWRLCYLFEDIPVESPDETASEPDVAGFLGLPPTEEDFIVDAHSGEIVERIPRSADATASGQDELNAQRQFAVSAAQAPSAGQVMIDGPLGLETFDLRLGDIETQLGGRVRCANPPAPWSKAAVSAHANASEVVGFLRNVLGRMGVDNRGSPLRSTVNCTYARHGSPGPGEWHNAAWANGQMFYGQRRVAGQLVSTAADVDVVAHEVMHGVTQSSANLQYLGESGALNESYSDIFGVIVANAGTADPRAWDFRMGKTFRGTGVPLRDLADPAAHGQPAHMNDYRRLPLTAQGDWGGVHINSGIHNKAAHLIITAVDAAGYALFTPRQLAGIFYLALTEHLSRTSVFSDSRRGLGAAVLTLFRNATQGEIDARRDAVEAAFSAVGVP